MRKMMITAILLIGFAGLILETGSAQAQSIFLEPSSGGGIHLEALRPSYEDLELTFYSFTFYLSSRVVVGDNLQLRVELPFVYFKEEEGYYYYDPYYGSYSRPPRSESSFGNPYLGVDFGEADNGFQGEVGFRVPVFNGVNSAAAIGMLTDPVERLEAFGRDLLPLYFGGNYRYINKSGFGLRLRMVPVFWLYLDNSGGSSNNDIHVIYSAQAWYEAGKIGVGGGLSGRAIATGDADGFGERSLHQFGFFANFALGQIITGIQARVPLDSDLKNSGMNTIFSLSIGVKL